MKKQAFTLIELLVVIAIIGILTSFIIVSMSGAQGAANDARRKADINQLTKAVLIYKTNNIDTPLLIDADGCQIGNDCASNTIFGNASTLKDPNGSYYVYTSSDGIDFTISSILSNDNNYIFDSSTGIYAESSPVVAVNGVCGLDNNTITAITPTNLCSAGTASSIATDSNTVLLMHMDGSDNGTVFNDQTGKTVTRYGDTKTVTSVKKFGSASAYFDGSGDYLTIPDSDDWDFGTDPFTIEFWMYVSATPSIQYTIYHQGTADNRLTIVFSNDNKIGFQCYQSGAYQWNISSSTILNGWHHVSLVRNENYQRFILMEVSQEVHLHQVQV
jgi:prepilin-type N-terminal cleavage/methylation domain-containing protein